MSVTIIENTTGKQESFLAPSQWELLVRNHDHNLTFEDDGVEEFGGLAGDQPAIDSLGAVAKGKLGVGIDDEISTGQGLEVPEPEGEGASVSSALADQLVDGSDGLGNEASFEAVTDPERPIGHESSPVRSGPGADDTGETLAGIVQEAADTTPGVGDAAGPVADAGPAAPSKSCACGRRGTGRAA